MSDNIGKPCPLEPANGDWLTNAEAASLLRLTPDTLRSYRVKGRGPNYYKNGNMVRYRRSEVEAYLYGEACCD